MFLSTMNAKRTRVFPPTVKRMHAAKQIAIIIVCHNANGGRTGCGPSKPAEDKECDGKLREINFSLTVAMF
jgi:hypothetical protein